MKRFILLTFVFMGWGFYEMSGGADFKAGPEIATAPPEPAGTAPETVSRADSSSNELIKLSPVPDVPDLDITLASVDRRTMPQPEFDTDAEKLAALVAQGISASESDSAATTEPADLWASDRADDSGDAANSGVLYSIDDFNRAPTASQDVREVTGSRVNLRNGPGTNYSVVGQLGRGDAVVVLQNTGDGWLKLKVAETNRVGWMADFLVTASAE